MHIYEKDLRIKYTSIINMRAYYIPVFEKVLRTVGIYMIGVRMRYIGM